MIINIRGGNGSGKSYVVQTLLRRFGCVPFTGHDGKVWGYRLKDFLVPVYIVGRYETQCGGCDAFTAKGDTDRYLRLVAEKSRQGCTLFEGVIQFGAQRYVALCQDTHVVLGLLDTPWKTCVERVVARRKAAGNVKPFDPERTARDKFKGCQLGSSYVEAIRRVGADVRLIPHKKSVTTVLSWILEDLVVSG